MVESRPTSPASAVVENPSSSSQGPNVENPSSSSQGRAAPKRVRRTLPLPQVPTHPPPDVAPNMHIAGQFNIAHRVVNASWSDINNSSCAAGIQADLARYNQANQASASAAQFGVPPNVARGPSQQALVDKAKQKMLLEKHIKVLERDTREVTERSASSVFNNSQQNSGAAAKKKKGPRKIVKASWASMGVDTNGGEDVASEEGGGSGSNSQNGEATSKGKANIALSEFEIDAEASRDYEYTNAHTAQGWTKEDMKTRKRMQSLTQLYCKQGMQNKQAKKKAMAECFPEAAKKKEADESKELPKPKCAPGLLSRLLQRKGSSTEDDEEQDKQQPPSSSTERPAAQTNPTTSPEDIAIQQQKAIPATNAHHKKMSDRMLAKHMLKCKNSSRMVGPHAGIHTSNESSTDTTQADVNKFILQRAQESGVSITEQIQKEKSDASAASSSRSSKKSAGGWFASFFGSGGSSKEAEPEVSLSVEDEGEDDEVTKKWKAKLEHQKQLYDLQIEKLEAKNVSRQNDASWLRRGKADAELALYQLQQDVREERLQHVELREGLEKAETMVSSLTRSLNNSEVHRNAYEAKLHQTDTRLVEEVALRKKHENTVEADKRHMLHLSKELLETKNFCEQLEKDMITLQDQHETDMEILEKRLDQAVERRNQAVGASETAGTASKQVIEDQAAELSALKTKINTIQYKLTNAETQKSENRTLFAKAQRQALELRAEKDDAKKELLDLRTTYAQLQQIHQDQFMQLQNLLAVQRRHEQTEVVVDPDMEESFLATQQRLLREISDSGGAAGGGGGGWQSLTHPQYNNNYHTEAATDDGWPNGGAAAAAVPQAEGNNNITTSASAKTNKSKFSHLKQFTPTKYVENVPTYTRSAESKVNNKFNESVSHSDRHVTMARLTNLRVRNPLSRQEYQTRRNQLEANRMSNPYLPQSPMRKYKTDDEDEQSSSAAAVIRAPPGLAQVGDGESAIPASPGRRAPPPRVPPPPPPQVPAARYNPTLHMTPPPPRRTLEHITRVDTPTANIPTTNISTVNISTAIKTTTIAPEGESTADSIGSVNNIGPTIYDTNVAMGISGGADIDSWWELTVSENSKRGIQPGEPQQDPSQRHANTYYSTQQEPESDIAHNSLRPNIW